MSDRIGILLSSAGRRVALMGCLRDAARQLGLTPRMVAIDIAPAWSPACQLADVQVAVPRCDAPEFADAVLSICRREGVRLLVPTIDPELPVYARQADSLRAAGVHVAVPDAGFVALASDKRESVAFLRRCGVPTPAAWTLTEAARRPTADFPMIVKPRAGSASVGVACLADASALENFRRRVAGSAEDWIVQARCSGRELTVHAYYRRGRLLSAVPHHRHRVRAGEVCLGETVVCAAAHDAAARIGGGWPGLSGVICFQGFEDDAGFLVTEINARFGGGYPLADAAGAGFARALLREARGEAPEMTGDYKVGLRMLRYDAAVFRDGKGSQPC